MVTLPQDTDARPMGHDTRDAGPSADEAAAKEARWDAIDRAKDLAQREPPQVLTLDLIKENPWNAVYLAIDDAARTSPDLLAAALSASEAMAAEASAAWTRTGLNGDGFAVDDANDAIVSLDAIIEGRDRDASAPQANPGPSVTLEAIQRNPWNAVDLTMPADTDAALLETIKETAGRLAEEKFQEMEGILSGELPAPEWAGDHDAPDAHEEVELDYLRAAMRFDKAASLIESRNHSNPQHVAGRSGEADARPNDDPRNASEDSASPQAEPEPHRYRELMNTSQTQQASNSNSGQGRSGP